GPTGSSPTPIALVYDDLDNHFEHGLAVATAGTAVTGKATETGKTVDTAEATATQPAACKAGFWSVLGPFPNPRDAKGRSTGHAAALPPGLDAVSHVGRDGPIGWIERRDLREDA